MLCRVSIFKLFEIIYYPSIEFGGVIYMKLITVLGRFNVIFNYLQWRSMKTIAGSRTVFLRAVPPHRPVFSYLTNSWLIH